MAIFRGVRAYWPIILAFLVLLLITKSTALGDMHWYTRNIVAHEHSDFRDYGSQLWEFGHLILRPVGYVVYRATKPFFTGVLGWGEFLSARTSLVAISLMAAFCLAVVFQKLGERISGSRMTGFIVALAMLSSNVVLLFAGVGTSYIPGLLFLAVAVLLGANPSLRGWGRGRAIAAGVSLGVSIIFWFPYVMAAPAAVLTGLFRPLVPAPDDLRGRARRSLTMALSAIATLILAYGVAMYILGIHSLGAFGTWVAKSHSMTQNRNLLRMLIGFPKAFLGMGDSGMLFKRYLYHDPYAGVTLGLVVRSALWKLGFFYAAALLLLIQLTRTSRGRAALLLLGAALIPVLGFAVYFEAGSAERYLALFPFLVIILAAALRDAGKEPARAVIVVLLLFTGLVNIQNLWRPSVERQWLAVVNRETGLRANVSSNDLVWVHNDFLWSLSEVLPYRNRGLNQDLPLDEIVSTGDDWVPIWRQRFVARTMETWKSGHDVWVTKRIFADRPNPSWGWVEGDDPRIRWKDLVSFARGLEVEKQIGGDDGFVKLANSTLNHQYLLAQADAGNHLPTAIPKPQQVPGQPEN